MRGMSGIGHHPGMRRLSRPGSAGCSRGFVCLPGLHGRRSRCGTGPEGTVARERLSRGLETVVPCKVTVRALPGRIAAIRERIVLRPAARAFPAPPQGATCGVQPRCIGALPSALVGVQPTTAPSAPSRGAGKAAASSRPALQPRRASVVTTAKLGSDDAVRRRIDNPETRVVSGFPPTGAEQRKSAGKCRGAKRGFFRVRQKKVRPRCSTLYARRNRMPS